MQGWPEPPTVAVSLIQAEFATWTGARFSQSEFEHAWWTDGKSDFAQAALAGAGLDPEPTHYSLCTNGFYLAENSGIPTVDFGVERSMQHTKWTSM